MGTAGMAIDWEQAGREIGTRLVNIPAVESAHLLPTENALSVWVGINEDDFAIRKTVYRVEDELSELFPMIPFDFHVVPLSADVQMENYVSEAAPIFRRVAA